MTTILGKIDEIAPNLFRLEQDDETRIISQYILLVGKKILVIDAGLPSSAEFALIPTLKKLADHVSEISLLITHPDADHFGGTAKLKEAFPDLTVIAHIDDCPPLGSLASTIERRYEPFKLSDEIELSNQAHTRINSRMGSDFEVSKKLNSDLVFAESPFGVNILHIPGHSAGHLGVWIPDSKILISGDGVMGLGIRNRDGSFLYPPQFISPTIYRSSIEKLQKLKIELLLCSHEQPLREASVDSFLQESLVSIDELSYRTKMAIGNESSTLLKICAKVHASYDSFPKNREADFALSIQGILMEMESQGTLTVDSLRFPRSFRRR